MPEAYVSGDLRGVEREEFEHHFPWCFECSLAVLLGSFILDLGRSATRDLPSRERALQSQLHLGATQVGYQPLTAGSAGGVEDDVCEFIKNKFPERYLQGRLSDAEQHAFADHYFACSACFRRLTSGSNTFAC